MNGQEFMQKHGIKASVRRLPEGIGNPAMEPPTAHGQAQEKERAADLSWYRQASHWVVMFSNGEGQSVTTRYSMGSAHTKPPKPAAVLETVTLDCASYENAPDEADWLDEYGYNAGSAYSLRKGMRAYAATKESAATWRALLGNEAYEELCWQVQED